MVLEEGRCAHCLQEKNSAWFAYHAGGYCTVVRVIWQQLAMSTRMRTVPEPGQIWEGCAKLNKSYTGGVSRDITLRIGMLKC